MNDKPVTQPPKNMHQILNGAADVLLVDADELKDVTDDRRRSTEHRYMVFGLMERAGYTHQQIATFFGMNRENVTKALTKLGAWVELYADSRGKYLLLKSRTENV